MKVKINNTFTLKQNSKRVFIYILIYNFFARDIHYIKINSIIKAMFYILHLLLFILDNPFC